jgi:catechol 2,3-dioxygenase-like lactoylglutathione lyase family enzyme
MEEAMAEAATKPDRRAFHISLNVRDLSRSIAFYEVFLGVAPAKSRPDYAKFELEDPPVVLSLEPAGKVSGSTLNHLGLRMTAPETLVDIQRRLEDRGYATRRENGVACCYARQTKFWVRDPDGRRWEVYVLEEDLDHRDGDRSNVFARVAAPARTIGGHLAAAWRRTRRAVLPVGGALRP